MNKIIFIIGVILAIGGMFLPIPGPADDPIDWTGYIMMAYSIYKTMTAKKEINK